jgi:methylenetetrahydrofolate reductase (NADPH)
MKIIDKIEQAQKNKEIAYSFEYFPPKTELVKKRKKRQ